MVVQHNLIAMNSNRMLGVTTKKQAKSTEKLSSGYKINRAADDAAGLAISEKMRKQIRGLTQASANAQDGISAVQTAEGALTEVHDMLQRLNELAVKAANGTNSESDRTAIQAEVDQLTTEIDRVAETTKFNETYLLKGDKDAPKGYSYSYTTYTTSSVAGGAATFAADSVTSLKVTVAVATVTALNQDDINEVIKAMRDSGISVIAESKWDTDGSTLKATTYSLQLNGGAAQKYNVVATSVTGGKFEIQDKKGNKLMEITTSGYTPTATSSGDQKDIVVFNAESVQAAACTASRASYYDRDGNRIPANALEDYFTSYNADNGTVVTTQVKAGSPKVYDAVGNETTLKSAEVSAVRDKVGDLNVGLHVGADATSNNQIKMNLSTMSSKGLGINGIKVDGADDSNAMDAIERVKAAITKVSAQRSDLGAVQNRLEHTINNLDNVVENTTSAESSIRDTDMATMMVQYSNNNILAQAGTSMLAQANQANQSVLSLLQ
ncbi:flagellar hook protein [bacterium 1XD8-76]|nr:flagellar hook protein [bacterium 1XD8-76]